MPYATPIALAARERLREHQDAAAKAVAAYEGALGKLCAARSCRAAVVVRHDALIADAETQVARALAVAARVMGVDVAAAVLGSPKAALRRASTVTAAQ